MNIMSWSRFLSVLLLAMLRVTSALAQEDAESGFEDDGFAESAYEWEINGSFKNETALFTRSGPTIGNLASTTATANKNGGDLLKFENSIDLYVNQGFSEDTSLHAQLNLVYDTEGTDGYKGHGPDTQNDILRELYVDTIFGPMELRIGKQQVVWGTADGIKLLDIVNPTDWREFVQNTMEDARIPVWMIKAETEVGDNGSAQLLVIQRRENAVPGLNASGDMGQPFKMYGVDSITGKVNGFLNIAPALGAVANTFHTASGNNLQPFNTSTVQEFVDNGVPAFQALFGGATSAAALNTTAQGTNNNITNLIDGSNWDAAAPNSAFEYMNSATFATFDAFANATSEYRRDYPDEIAPNLGFSARNSIGDNFNFSLNYLWHYDPNPYVETHWENAAGDRLSVNTTTATGDGNNSNGNADANGTTYTTVTLTDSSGASYGGVSGNAANLVFTERLNRIHSLGSAFDYAMDSKSLGPVVLRGEFLYQIDTKVPVIDRTKLGYGDLTGALKMAEADMFKYVLGADFTFFTNLMISGQFIQFINLDYIDEADDGSANSGRYSADPSVMHLATGLKKAEEFKEFYSLFLSKPFGEEQQGRWNNILMFEEGGGFWNRLDIEYAFSDDIVATTEFNAYFGATDTMFGQFKNSSNIQIGMKYFF